MEMGRTNLYNFKMLSTKIGKNSKSRNFEKFLKILNGHKIRTINTMALKLSELTSHTDTNKWWNFEQNLEPLRWTKLNWLEWP